LIVATMSLPCLELAGRGMVWFSVQLALYTFHYHFSISVILRVKMFPEKKNISDIKHDLMIIKK